MSNLEKRVEALEEVVGTSSKKFNSGDVVTCKYGKRIMLYDKDGDLMAYDFNGCMCGTASVFLYDRTGQNIFDILKGANA